MLILVQFACLALAAIADCCDADFLIVTRMPDMWRTDFLAHTGALSAQPVSLATAAVGPLKLHHSSQLHSPAIGVQFAALGALVLHPVW